MCFRVWILDILITLWGVVWVVIWGVVWSVFCVQSI